MPDLPPEAITAAAKVHHRMHCVTCGWPRPGCDGEPTELDLAATRKLLEAAVPHLAAARPTGIIHIEDGVLSEAGLEELAERWKAACSTKDRERIAELEQLATEVIASYHQASDGYRGRVGQVQIAKWQTRLAGEATQ